MCDNEKDQQKYANLSIQICGWWSVVVFKSAGYNHNSWKVVVGGISSIGFSSITVFFIYLNVWWLAEGQPGQNLYYK